jgi:hypothetical protein
MPSRGGVEVAEAPGDLRQVLARDGRDPQSVEVVVIARDVGS